MRSGTGVKANEACSSPTAVELRRGSGGPIHAGGSPARSLQVFDRQRQMLERDLHDGVQQRLVAVRIRLALAAELAGGDPLLHETLADIGEDVQAAIEELRDVAHGIYPHVLSDHGVTAALTHVARTFGGAVTISSDMVGRYPAEVESAIYYCCREAIQNAVKHGGPTAQIALSLYEDARTIGFEVSDGGRGFDLTESSCGRGLQHMRDRVGSVGGELSIFSRRGAGCVVTGTIPRSLHRCRRERGGGGRGA